MGGSGTGAGSERRLVVRPPQGPPGRAKNRNFQWRYDDDRQWVMNEGLGVLVPRVDVVWSDTGELHHEGFVMGLSRRAEQDVVLDDDGNLGLIHIWREKVVPPERNLAIWTANPCSTPTVEDITGVYQWEVAQCLALKEGEEAEEEIGRKVITKRQIGYQVPNTPLGGNGHVLIYARVGKRPSGKSADESEGIKRVKFFSPSQIIDLTDEMINASSVSALYKWRAWARRQDRRAQDFDELAYEVAGAM